VVQLLPPTKGFMQVRMNAFTMHTCMSTSLHDLGE
jgi:hypothetical protein